MSYTNSEIDDLIRRAKCCAKPKFVDELPETVIENKFIIFEDTLYIGHEGEWLALGGASDAITGSGTTDTLAYWTSSTAIGSASINTGLSLSGGVINSSYRDKKIVLCVPHGLNLIWLGARGTVTASNSVAIPTFTNLYTSIYRWIGAPTAATANLAFGTKIIQASYFRGSSVAGTGGFKFFAQGGVDVWDNSCRFFAGFSTADTVVTSNPSDLDNTVGFAVDDDDSGQIHFLTRDTTATKEPTGLFLSNNQGFNFSIECEPGGSSYSWSITAINTGVTSSGVATLTLPVQDTLLAPRFLGGNAANASTTIAQIGLSRIYIESNY